MNSPTVLFMLEHQRELEHWRSGFVDTKLIGYFDDITAAGDAIEYLATKPGFRDYPGGFRVRRVVVDHNMATGR